jgi:hypothetical protein
MLNMAPRLAKLAAFGASRTESFKSRIDSANLRFTLYAPPRYESAVARSTLLVLFESITSVQVLIATSTSLSFVQDARSLPETRVQALQSKAAAQARASLD